MPGHTRSFPLQRKTELLLEAFRIRHEALSVSKTTELVLRPGCFMTEDYLLNYALAKDPDLSDALSALASKCSARTKQKTCTNK